MRPIGGFEKKLKPKRFGAISDSDVSGSCPENGSSESEK
jgi:hypothetical protein